MPKLPWDIDHARGELELLDADLHRNYWKDWGRVLKAYLANPTDFYRAERFMECHPANQRFKWGCPESWWHQNLWWCAVVVNPATGRIEKDKHLNTRVEVWVKWGPYMESIDMGSHDPRVDTGATTFEQAIINLAHNVWTLYRDLPTVDDSEKLKKKDRW